jgi:ATP-dependent Clp protease protease subunit
MNNEFEKYAVKHLGIGSNNVDSYSKMQSKAMGVINTPVQIYDNYGAPKASITPTIIEERQLNVAAMSVFDRLMMDNIIWCAGVVDDRMSIIFQAQLLFLSEKNPNKTITIHVDSPGGSVKSGLGMVDLMDYVRQQTKVTIATVNTGMAASMGSVLLGAGDNPRDHKTGRRSSLKHSRTMLHQSSGGTQGNIQDAEIQWEEWKKVNEELFIMLGSYCDKTAEQIKEDASRDLWLSAEESYKYGIIDDIIGYSEEDLKALKGE